MSTRRAAHQVFGWRGRDTDLRFFPPMGGDDAESENAGRAGGGWPLRRTRLFGRHVHQAGRAAEYVMYRRIETAAVFGPEPARGIRSRDLSMAMCLIDLQDGDRGAYGLYLERQAHGAGMCIVAYGSGWVGGGWPVHVGGTYAALCGPAVPRVRAWLAAHTDRIPDFHELWAGDYLELAIVKPD